MTETVIPPAVLAGAGAAVRAYLRMGAGEAGVVDAACAAACGAARRFLGAELGAAWADLPGPVAQGIVLHAAQLIEHRDGRGAPAGALALLRPYRAARLVPDPEPTP
jgi:hypothetical protein